MARAWRLEFPLLSRELTRTGRRRLHFALRMGPVGFVFGFFMIEAMFWRGQRGSLTPDELSMLLRNLSRAFQFAVVFGLAPFLAAGLIAEEKRSRTFELLLLADLRGGDLYFAKLASAFGQIMMLLLSTLPLIAICSMLGGIYVPAEALRLLVLSSCGFAVCTIALLFSATARTPLDALLGTIGVVTLATLGPVPLNSSRMTLFGYIWEIDSANMFLDAWLPVVLVALVVAAVCAVITILILPTSLALYAVPKATRRRRKQRQRRFFRPNETTRFAEAMLAGGRVSGAGIAWRAIVAICLVPIGLMSFFFGTGVALLAAIAAYEITSSMAAARNAGTLDELLVTPIESRSLAKAIVKAFRRRTAFLYPAIAAPYLFLLVVAVQALFDTTPGDAVLELSLASLILPISVLFPALMLWCFCTAGCAASTFRMGPAAQAASVGAIAMGGQIVLMVVGMSVGFLNDIAVLAVLAFLVYGGAHICAGFAFFGNFEATVHSTWRSDTWESALPAGSAPNRESASSLGPEGE